MKKDTFVRTSHGKTGIIIKPQYWEIGYYKDIAETEFVQLAVTYKENEVKKLVNKYSELVTYFVQSKVHGNLVRVGIADVYIKDSQLNMLEEVRINTDPVDHEDVLLIMKYYEAHGIQYYLC